MNIITKTTKKVFFSLILVLSQFVWVSCVDNDPIVEHYYTFTGETVDE